MTLELPEPTADDVALVQQVFQLWQQGNHPQALQALEPRLASDEPWAQGFAAWLHMQQGVGAYDQAARYALQAARAGLPWVAFHLFNNIIGNLSNAPHLLPTALELARTSIPWTSGIDPVGQGWSLISQGRPEDGLRLLMLRMRMPFYPDAWDAITANAQAKLAELDSTVTAAHEQKANLEQAASEGLAVISSSADEIKTSAGQANLLITTIVSDSATTLYKAAAERSEKESRAAWTWGLRVLGAAAVVAVLPLIIHYLGFDPNVTLETCKSR